VVETYKGVFRALCLISVFYCLFDVVLMFIDIYHSIDGTADSSSYISI